MNVSIKMLSLPPYVSVSWKYIVSLQVENRPYGHVLVIQLTTGKKIEIPNLEKEIIKEIFIVHAKFLELSDQKISLDSVNFAPPGTLSGALSSPLGVLSIMQHSPEHASSPSFPPEILEKISMFTRHLIPGDLSTLPSPEPHCNCPYCQVIRAVLGTGNNESSKVILEERVSEEDLKFRSWDIKQEGEKLYTVTNPLDVKEHYNVFLGEPLGCTCGNKNCEHIQAVLKS